MTIQPKAGAVANAARVRAVDPLADLRADGERVETLVPEVCDDPVTRIIKDWHGDDTCRGLLHRGMCGCRYLAERALEAIT